MFLGDILHETVSNENLVSVVHFGMAYVLLMLFKPSRQGDANEKADHAYQTSVSIRTPLRSIVIRTYIILNHCNASFSLVGIAKLIRRSDAAEICA